MKPVRPDRAAAASLLLGLAVFLGPLTAVPALVLGLRALRRMRLAEPPVRGRALAIGGILLACLSMAVWIVIAGLFISAGDDPNGDDPGDPTPPAADGPPWQRLVYRCEKPLGGGLTIHAADLVVEKTETPDGTNLAVDIQPRALILRAALKEARFASRLEPTTHLPTESRKRFRITAGEDRDELQEFDHARGVVIRTIDGERGREEMLPPGAVDPWTFVFVTLPNEALAIGTSLQRPIYDGEVFRPRLEVVERVPHRVTADETTTTYDCLRIRVKDEGLSEFMRQGSDLWIDAETKILVEMSLTLPALPEKYADLRVVLSDVTTQSAP